jgi:hypothetical protein
MKAAFPEDRTAGGALGVVTGIDPDRGADAAASGRFTAAGTFTGMEAVTDDDIAAVDRDDYSREQSGRPDQVTIPES